MSFKVTRTTWLKSTGRGRSILIYLDTHVVVWLYAGLLEKFSPAGQTLLNEHDLLISPIVRLELTYLHEIQRVTVDADVIIAELADRVYLEVCRHSFDAVVRRAVTCTWTRDPFDRIIVAQAALGENILLTKDMTIQEHYPFAQW